ncbi:MAG: PEP-CTERM sorting domain-containing protein [Kiritimatiellia bacterium]|jgi:hypothetical protein|nr:PEP-CTERM sorting domain-containing protein [Kiritimatiellia bacterium]MDP7024082.1 PEP-CTERM sorting domain-containing protein [Kiritimatiellia bacterium]
MKNILGAAIAMTLFAGVSLADTTYDWGHGSDLGSGWDGYLVYLYSSSGTTLPTAINGDLSTDSGFSTVSGITDTIADGGKAGYIYTGVTFDVGATGDVAADDYVISVVFDTGGPIVAGATQWTYLNGAIATPYQVADTTNPEQFATTGSGNGWTTVVPEPSSIALFGLGLITLAAGSRRYLRK